MTYVMSDVHGMYDRFMTLMKKADFTKDDTLFILGDLVDYGPDSCKLLLNLSGRDNVFPILGNHDFEASVMLPKLMADPDCGDGDDTPGSVRYWLSHGGEATWQEFSKLSRDDQEWILEYIEEFSLYEVITVEDQKYILVHAGLGGYDPKKKMSAYTLPELIYGQTDYTKEYYHKSILVTGHISTRYIGEQYRGRVYHGPRQLAIDCGASKGVALGMVCLDTGEEFYA